MKNLAYILLAAAVYLAISSFPLLSFLVWPISLLCTFLHEFGHAFFSVISGGTVHALVVNLDGSGVTTTSGGSPGLCTIGGYIGSAVFGNLMILLSGSKYSSFTLKVISFAMMFACFWWFGTFVTSALLFLFSIGLFYVSRLSFNSLVLSFLGVASVIYIIQDFNVGPGSDLRAYENQVGIFPASVWMYLWLFLVLATTGWTLWHISKKKNFRTGRS